jgi:hypothetical protein
MSLSERGQLGSGGGCVAGSMQVGNLLRPGFS